MKLWTTIRRSMHNRVFLSAVVLATSAASTSGQTPVETVRGSVTGRVTERITGQPISNAHVSIETAAEATTDSDGLFRLEVAAGTYTIRVKAEGFAPLVVPGVTVTSRRTTAADLRLDVLISEEVDVPRGHFPEDPGVPISLVELSRGDIRSTPGTGGDILRVVGTLPGVTTASGEFADLIVRGGTVTENLTFVDNIPVGESTYFTDQYDNGRGGRISLLTPDTIDRLEFYSGGFPVRFGDRMSSALDVTLRKAARNRVQGVAYLDSGAFGGTLEVPLGKRGGWLFSARRSYVDIAFDIFDIGEIGRPRDFDFTNKIDYDLTPKHKISVTALNLFERFTATLDEALRIDRRVDQLVTDRRVRRLTLGITLSSTLGNKTFSQLTTWATGQHNDGTFRRAIDFDFSMPFTVISLDGQTLQRTRDLRDSEIGIKEELTAQVTPRLVLGAGGGIISQQAEYFVFERTGMGFSPIEEEFLAPTRANRLVIDATASAYGYVQVTQRLGSRFWLTPGVRVDRYGIVDQTLVSPRMSARVRVSPRVALSVAAGVFRQPPALFVLALTPENRTLKTQRAVHFIGGVEWLPREDLRVTVEAYEKRYDDLLVRPTLTSPVYTNDGDGYARGFDVVLQKPLTGRFAGQAMYSFVHSRRRLSSEGVSFPADTERPNQLTLIGMTRLFGFNFAAKLRLASGLPHTLYTPIQFRPGFFLQRLANQADRNAGRLPIYAQLDMRADRRFSFNRWSFAPYIDVLNVFGRINRTERNYTYFDPVGGSLGEGRAVPLFGAKVEF